MKGFRLWFDRLLSKSILIQFTFLAIVLLLIFLLSYVCLQWSGCDWSFAEKGDVPQWLLPIYLLIDTNALNNLYMNGVHGMALFFSSVIYLIGLFIFNGMIISIITNAIDRRVQDHREGKRHYLKSGHYIIMGYDEMIPSFIRHIFEKDKEAYVLLLTSVKATDLHETLRKSFDQERMKRIIINYGHRTSTDYYKGIHLESAKQIYIVGNHSKLEHDAINVECVDHIYDYLKGKDEKPQRITCVFNDLDTYAAFKTSEIFKKVGELDMEFVPYNVYSGWAKQVFVKRYYTIAESPDKKIPYATVFGKGITPEDNHYVHLVFVGTTNFAIAFAMEAAHVLHFPNFNRDNSLKTRITFIDVNADKEKDEFITRYRHFFEVQSYLYQDLSDKPSLDMPDTSASYFSKDRGYTPGKDNDFLDVQFEFIKGDIFSAKVQKLVSQWAEDKDKQYLSIFLALANQHTNFVMGMNMPDEVYDNNIPVFIRQDRSDNFVTNLRETDEQQTFNYAHYDAAEDTLKQEKRNMRYAHIYPFGMNETAYSADETSLNRAMLINYLYSTADYGAYRFKGILTLSSIPEQQIWDEARKHWKELTVALKWSNLYNAYTIRTKLATLRAMRGLDINDDSLDRKPLSEDEVEELARVEHNRWNVEKLLMGFRKARTDEDKYAHPGEESRLSLNKKLYIHHDIRPYEDLGNIQRLDREFSRYIPWIIKMTETT